MMRMRYAREIVGEVKKIDENTSITVGFIKKIAQSDKIRTAKNGKRTLICLDDVLASLEGGVDRD